MFSIIPDILLSLDTKEIFYILVLILIILSFTLLGICIYLLVICIKDFFNKKREKRGI